jgi:hypothetical protein
MSEAIFTDGTELVALHSLPSATVQGSATFVAKAQIIRPRSQQIVISVNSEISRTVRYVGQTQRLLSSKLFAGSSQTQSSEVFQSTKVCVQVWLPDCYLLSQGCFAPRWSDARTGTWPITQTAGLPETHVWLADERKRRIYPMQAMKWILATALAAAIAPNIIAQQPSADIHPAATESQETNIRAYVELLRVDVKTKKTAIFTEIIQFNELQAAKFWPIYNAYDTELQKLNDQKLAGIQEYAKNFGSMTDEKADELAMLALELENKRNDLKKTYYEKVREQLGGIVAARFLQIENQLLMVIDLQIAASLPIVG